jgi:hypothetical protein
MNLSFTKRLQSSGRLIPACNSRLRLFTNISVLLFLLTSLPCCTKNKVKENHLFETLTSDRTGLNFTNKLTPSPEMNMFKYMYYYNGGGVGAGDFNRDGLVDLFFSANQGDNKIFLNDGELKFRDVTIEAKIPQDGGWATGVSVVDINNDSLLDIYICKVGQYGILQGKNQLLICRGIDSSGIPAYSDEAKDYGLDFSGFSTQAAFFDYDLDGDLDMYLLNHAVHHDGHFNERKLFLGTRDSVSGDFLYRNDGNKFIDATEESGINNSAIGYGLGIAVSDINLDGYPDIYVGNDFHENDYLYINQKNGTFRDELPERIMHTSQFSMGVDIADINNDGHPEIISVDMLPSDPYILKRSLGDNEYDIFNMKISFGYNHQYSRNTLQFNRKNGFFSECDMYSGVYASDWSWAPLWMDFDNDGLKDLFISNGIPKRLNDIDYVNFVSNEEIKEKIRRNSLDDNDQAIIEKFPEIRIKNKFFKNTGQLSFTDQEDSIGSDIPTYSNGAAYADFDNDGDLDIVVNNIDEPVILYKNQATTNAASSFLEVKLAGPPGNVNAVGAKLILYGDNQMRCYEKYPVRGFQSSMEIPIHIGLAGSKIDSMILIWPDNSYQRVDFSGQKRLVINYRKNLAKFQNSTGTHQLNNRSTAFTDVSSKVNLNFKHVENPFVEFDREPLMPHMVSREGPALAIGDLNNDHLDDVFVGGSKGTKSGIFLQQPSGLFKKSFQPQLDNDSSFEDADACWVDVNNDNRTDLIIASAGNEYFGTDRHLIPRVYLNKGNGNLERLDNAFESLYLTASCVIPYDFTGDGYIDLFIGGRAVPWEYGKIPSSFLLENDKTGKFRDVTSKHSSQLSQAGLVTDAIWFDVDADGDKDIVLALEWGGIDAYINDKGKFSKRSLTDKKGWWNFVLPVDVDKDGDVDFIAGNLGLNNRFNVSGKTPLRMYYNDFDGNGKKEQLLTYYVNGREIPFMNKDELQRQIPGMKKRFLYAADFARSTLAEIFTTEKLRSADTLSADYFANAILINMGNWNFALHPLPWEAQLSPYKDGINIHVNHDSLPDLLLAGNFFNSNVQLGRFDADFGSVLINKGNGSFVFQTLGDLRLKGEVRKIGKIKIGEQQALVLARNNDSIRLINFR